MAPQESSVQAERDHLENQGRLLQHSVTIALHLTDEKSYLELLNLQGSRRIASAHSGLLLSNRHM